MRMSFSATSHPIPVRRAAAIPAPPLEVVRSNAFGGLTLRPFRRHPDLWLPLVPLIFGFWPQVLPARAEGIPEPNLIWYGSVFAGTPPVPLSTFSNVVWQITNSSTTLSVAATIVQVNGQTFYVARVPLETRVAGTTVFTPNTNALGLGVQPATYNRQVTVNGNLAVPSGTTATNQTFSLSGADRGRVDRIDLLVGIADSFKLWLTQFGLSSNTDPNSHPPNKPTTYYQEYVAGTDPRDSKSLFKFVDIRADQNGLTVYWAGFPGRAYTLERSKNLGQAGYGFTVLQQHLQATPPTNSFRDATATSQGPYVYRIHVE